MNVERRMRIVPRMMVIVSLLVAAGATACGAGSASGTGAGAGLPDGWPAERTFLSTAVTEHGNDRPLVGDSRIRLVIGRDGDLAAHAGCNHLSGTARFDDGRLAIDGGLAQTEMACDRERMDQDVWLAAFLTSHPAWRLAGDELVLASDEVEITFADRRVVEPDVELYRTEWIVDTIIDGDTASSVPAGAQASLRFDGAGRVDGFTGCADIGGTAAVGGTATDGAGVIAVALDGTPQCGDSARRGLHDAVLAALQGQVSFRIEGSRLTLTAPTGAGLGLTPSPGATVPS